MKMTLKSIFLSVVLLLTQGLVSNAKAPTLYKNTDKKAMEAWVDSVYSTLSPRERVAQLMMPTVLPGDSARIMDNLTHYVKRDKVGGMLLSKGCVADFVNAVNFIQKEADVPLLLSIDGEWGVSMRVKDALKFPKNMVLGAISDDRLIYEYGKELARQCKLLGIHVDFAPVLDVNTNPLNPIIGERSLGEDYRKVAQKGVTMSKGMEDGGLLSVAKHFPGHGSTSEDSHKTLPVVDKTMTEMETIDIYPFKKYIKSGLGGMLTAHLVLPAFDDTGLAGSMNPNVVTEYLKEKSGFEGLIFTDGLGMKGAAGEGSVCVRALKAGNDIMLSAKNISSEIDAIFRAFDSGELDEDEIYERCKKVLRYKYILKVHQCQPLELDGLKEKLNRKEAQSLLDRLYAASITVIKDDIKALPIKRDEYVALAAAFHPFPEIWDWCMKYAEVKTQGKVPETSDKIIVPITGNDYMQVSYLERMAKIGKPVVAIFFINPYKVAKFADVLKLDNVSAVMAYENVRLSRINVAKAIFGAIPITGKLPVTIPGVVGVGTGKKYPKILKDK